MELLGMNLLDTLTRIDELIWGLPLLVLLVGTGIFLTWRLGLIQIFRLPLALRYVLNSRKAEIGVQGDVSSFAALSTALSATIGTGNIVGVATAIKTGGPGALFWMFLAAFFSGCRPCIPKPSWQSNTEQLTQTGRCLGVPCITSKTGWDTKGTASSCLPLCHLRSKCGTLRDRDLSQVNAIVDSARIAFDIPEILTAAVLSLLVAFVTLGGIRRIAAVAQFMVPFMAMAYVLGCFVIIGLNLDKLPETLL